MGALSESREISVLYTGTKRPAVAHPQLRILHRPMLEPAPLDFDHQFVRDLTETARTLVFYSPNSVEVLAESGALSGLNLSEKTTWAVGEKTADTLAECLGINAHFPADQQFTGMLAEFHKIPPKQPLIAFGLEGSPRSLIGEAPGQFSAPSAAEIYEIPVYRTTVQAYPNLSDEMREAQIQWIAFTSPRGVATLVSQVEPSDLMGRQIAAIGPTTAAAIRRHGLTVDLLMQTPDRDLMMREIQKTAGVPS